MARSKSSIAETMDEIKIIRLGEKAVENLKRTFDHWMEIARALEAGRQACLRAAGVAEDIKRGEEGGAFAKLYSEWLKQHPKLKLSDTPASEKTIRSWLFKCLEHEIEIRAWRKDKGLVELSRFSFPETVFKRWAKDTDFEDAGPKRPRKKKDEKQKQDENSLDWARQTIKRKNDTTGEWDHDSAVQIAEKLQTHYPRRAEEVATVLLGEDRSAYTGLDWDATEDDLIETLLGMVPHNAKAVRVLQAVLNRLKIKAPSEEEMASA